MKKGVFTLLLLLMLWFLPACGGTLSIELETTPTPDHAPGATVAALEARIATLQPRKPGLDMNASSDAIRQALLRSHENWQTLWLDGQVLTGLNQGGGEKQRAQLWIDRTSAKFRSLTGPLDGAPQVLQVSDGASQSRINLESASAQTQALMPGANDLNWQAPATASDTEGIVSHPLDLEIDTPLSEMAFPAVFAQQSGTFTPAGMEKVAGRVALVVEYWWSAEMRARLWVDTETALILRWDAYSKESLSGGPATSIIITALELDKPFPADLFNLQIKEKPRFALDATGAEGAAPLPPEAVFKPGEGELYFVIDRSPEDLQLARLPGGCISGRNPCPQPQVVEGFPNKNNTVEPLIWSPDGRLAALVQQGMLYCYDPEKSDWKALAQFPILREGVAWAPDGTRLAFVSQAEDNRQDIYVVSADGSGLRNLTEGRFQGTDVSLWVDGFLADGRLLFEVIQRTSAQPYTLSLEEGAEPLPVSDLLLQHGILALAPDRQQAAYTSNQGGTAVLQVAGLDLRGDSSGGVLRKDDARRVATFQQASIQQVLWSAVTDPTTAAAIQEKGQWISFLVSSGSSAEQQVNTVYVVRPDGTDLRQLYQDSQIHRITFALNGSYIIATAAEPLRLYAIPIDGGEPRLIEAPGLRLDQRILGVSWRGK